MKNPQITKKFDRFRASGATIVALPKGRLMKTVLSYLKERGLDASMIMTEGNDRRLVFTDKKSGYGFLVVKPHDVARFVEEGTAHLGIVGSDVLREYEPNVYEPLDLKFGRCRLVLAGPAETKEKLVKRRFFTGGVQKDTVPLNIATTYPNITKKWLIEHKIDANLRPLYGSVEIAPVTGFAELIVDLVSTGNTLKQNGLVEIQTLALVTAKLIVNRAALKTKTQLASLIRALKP